jgi:hypothetical protein
VLHVLALTAATVSTVALLVVMSLTVFVVTLAFRAATSARPRRGTTDRQRSIARDVRANRSTTRLARDPDASMDRSA